LEGALGALGNPAKTRNPMLMQRLTALSLTPVPRMRAQNPLIGIRGELEDRSGGAVAAGVFEADVRARDSNVTFKKDCMLELAY
jgi:hypothetical protein